MTTAGLQPRHRHRASAPRVLRRCDALTPSLARACQACLPLRKLRDGSEHEHALASARHSHGVAAMRRAVGFTFTGEGKNTHNKVTAPFRVSEVSVGSEAAQKLLVGDEIVQVGDLRGNCPLAPPLPMLSPPLFRVMSCAEHVRGHCDSAKLFAPGRLFATDLICFCQKKMYYTKEVVSLKFPPLPPILFAPPLTPSFITSGGWVGGHVGVAQSHHRQHSSICQIRGEKGGRVAQSEHQQTYGQRKAIVTKV